MFHQFLIGNSHNIIRCILVAFISLILTSVPVSSDPLLELKYDLTAYWDFCEQFGRFVSYIGDLNGDSVSDIAVCMKHDIPNKIYLFNGMDGAILDTLISPGSGEYFGWSLDDIGDIDDDGIFDIVVGAIGEEPDSSPSYWGSGVAYTYSGRTGSLIQAIESPNDELRGKFGWATAGVGDVNFDGISDYVIGTPWEDPGESPEEAGKVYVYSGLNGDCIRELSSSAEEFHGFFGCAISGIGDVDGDSSGDIAIGAYGENPNTDLIDAGKVYIFNGSTGQLIYQMESPHAEWSGYFGSSISSTLDLDCDEIRDIIIGAPWEDPGESPGLAGKAYVFSGATGELLHEFSSPNEEINGYFGKTVTGIVDIDGDSIGECVVGAPSENPDSSPENSGRVYVFSGANGQLLISLKSPNEEERGYYGSALSGLPEKGGNAPALIVGAPGEWDDRGRVYVYDAIADVTEPMNNETPSIRSIYPIEQPVRSCPIRFLIDLRKDENLSLSIFDLSGRKLTTVREGMLSAGKHVIGWDGVLESGDRICNGTYVCRMNCRFGSLYKIMVVYR